MYRSTDRILTSHTGSLPRPPALRELIHARATESPYDPEALQASIRQAVADVVQQQVRTGIDIVNDGEQGRPSYVTYVKDRLLGFDGEHRLPVRGRGEARDFPEFAERRRSSRSTTAVKNPTCSGPITWGDFAAVQRDIANLQAAVDLSRPRGVFMTSASPGIISYFLLNEYYPTEDEYLDALSSAMRSEYEAIANAGFDVQIDSPDLAGSRHNIYLDLSDEEFLKIVALRVEIINEATKNIPPEKMRIHLCWGNYEGPHHLDVPLRTIIDLVLRCRPGTISFEGANPRHEHEWIVWEDVKLPDDKMIMPGVIDSTTNFIEHPELVCQRILAYARLVGRENVIAGVDCGFGSGAGVNGVDPRIAWAKLESLVAGAELASKRLW